MGRKRLGGGGGEGERLADKSMSTSISISGSVVSTGTGRIIGRIDRVVRGRVEGPG